jgi:hypothetical protein
LLCRKSRLNEFENIHNVRDECCLAWGHAATAFTTIAADVNAVENPIFPSQAAGALKILTTTGGAYFDIRKDFQCLLNTL